MGNGKSSATGMLPLQQGSMELGGGADGRRRGIKHACDWPGADGGLLVFLEAVAAYASATHPAQTAFRRSLRAGRLIPTMCAARQAHQV